MGVEGFEEITVEVENPKTRSIPNEGWDERVLSTTYQCKPAHRRISARC